MMELFQEIIASYSRELTALFFIFLLSHTTEAATGFGSNIITVSLGVFFLPLDTLIPVILPVNIFLSIYVVIFYRKNIALNTLTKRILPFITIGLTLGLIIFSMGDFSSLKRWFGLFVIFLTIFEFIRILIYNGLRESKPLSGKQAAIWLIAAGIVHGIYASSGPLVVYYAGKEFSDKKTFRSTLASLWFILTTILLLTFAISGKLTKETITMSFILLPSMVLGVISGEFIHKVINEKAFRIFVYIVLLFAGISLVNA